MPPPPPASKFVRGRGAGAGGGRGAAAAALVPPPRRRGGPGQGFGFGLWRPTPLEAGAGRDARRDRLHLCASVRASGRPQLLRCRSPGQRLAAWPGSARLGQASPRRTGRRRESASVPSVRVRARRRGQPERGAVRCAPSAVRGCERRWERRAAALAPRRGRDAKIPRDCRRRQCTLRVSEAAVFKGVSDLTDDAAGKKQFAERNCNDPGFSLSRVIIYSSSFSLEEVPSFNLLSVTNKYRSMPRDFCL